MELVTGERDPRVGARPADRLVADAVERCGGAGGVLYSAAPEALTQLAVTGRLPGGVGARRRAALHVLEDHLPHLVGPTREDGGAPGPALVALPCRLQSDLAGILVVAFDDEPREELATIVGRLGPLLPLALAADYERIRLTLEHHQEQARFIERQLEAYAVDIRTTYRAERERALELSRALDELAETYRATVRGLAIAVEAKDEYTGGHLYRVARYGLAMTAIVAPEHRHDPQYEYGFLLHDVGKLTVPDAVLTKPGKLTPEEWEVMRRHPEEGRNILEDIPFLAGAREIVYSHHERWDGTGYPRRLAGEEIPLGARIFPLADAFDAMTSDRPYRGALPFEVAVEEITKGSGTQFWPDAVDAFLALDEEELRSVQRDIPAVPRVA